MSNNPLTICRICEESRETSLVNITLPENKDLVIEFLACANVSYNIYDRLPKYFCHQCVTMLNDAYNFKGQCEKTEKKLLQLLCKDLNVKILDEETNYVSQLEYIKTEYPSETKIQNATVDYMEPIESTNENDLYNFDQSILIKEESSEVDLLDNKRLLSVHNNSFKLCECQLPLKSNGELKSHECSKVDLLFACDICKKQFKYRKYFDRHMLNHSRSYTCDICNKSCQQKKYLISHMAVHISDTPFKCKHCPKQFSTAKRLKRHSLYAHTIDKISLTSIHGDKPLLSVSNKSVKCYECYICNKSFWHKCNLVSHMRKVHGGDTPFKCIYCPKQFSTARGLKLHDLYLHSKKVGDKTYECDYCANKFTSANRLKRHILSKHTQPLIEKPYKCLLCTLKFRHKESLDNHTLKHQTKNHKPKKFICTICGLCFPSLGSLNNHMAIHSDDRPYACNLCDLKFKQKPVLAAHMQNHTGEKPFKCLECERAFTKKSILDKHKKTHNNDRPYECPICKESFRSPVTIGHMTRHTGEKPYKCENCEKSFITYHKLKRHLRSHTGVKPYACTLCNIGFVKIKTFEKHLEYHNGNESYRGTVDPRSGYHPIYQQYVSCSWCCGGFLTKRSLKFHETKHSGGKSFTCQICGQGFSTTNSLNEHKTVFHQNGVVQ